MIAMKPMSIMALVDEESKFPKVGHVTLLRDTLTLCHSDTLALTL